MDVDTKKGPLVFDGKELRYPNILEFTIIMTLILVAFFILGITNISSSGFYQILLLTIAACGSAIINILVKTYLMRDRLFL